MLSPLPSTPLKFYTASCTHAFYAASKPCVVSSVCSSLKFYTASCTHAFYAASKPCVVSSVCSSGETSQQYPWSVLANSFLDRSSCHFSRSNLPALGSMSHSYFLDVGIQQCKLSAQQIQGYSTTDMQGSHATARTLVTVAEFVSKPSLLESLHVHVPMSPCRALVTAVCHDHADTRNSGPIDVYTAEIVIACTFHPSSFILFIFACTSSFLACKNNEIMSGKLPIYRELPKKNRRKHLHGKYLIDIMIEVLLVPILPCLSQR